MKSADTLVCCGLDPDIPKFPKEIREKKISSEEKTLAFLMGAIDSTAAHVCAYKIQKAFFDIMPNGHDVLKSIIEYVHRNYPEIVVFVDCKIGDIDNTMDVYGLNLFEVLRADGVVVNPYMGDDAVSSLAAYKEKSILVLAKTSNPGGGIVQDVMLKNGQLLWEYMLSLILGRWNRNKNTIPILSSTAQMDMKYLRKMIPDHTPVFLAGVGVQGGDESSLKLLLNSEGIGVIINSSRGILYKRYRGLDWKTSIGRAAKELKERLNKQRQ